MNPIVKSGLGIIIIGLALALPYVQILDFSLTDVDFYIQIIIQIGMIIAGLGMVMQDE